MAGLGVPAARHRSSGQRAAEQRAAHAPGLLGRTALNYGTDTAVLMALSALSLRAGGSEWQLSALSASGKIAAGVTMERTAAGKRDPVVRISDGLRPGIGVSA